MRRPWTDGELAELRRLHAAGHPFSRIGRRLGRSIHSISAKMRDMGLVRVRPPPAAAEWEARRLAQQERNRLRYHRPSP